jgi:hypothetical protein
MLGSRLLGSNSMADLTNFQKKSVGRTAPLSRRKELREELPSHGITATLGAIVGVFTALRMPDQLKDNPFVGLTILGFLFVFLACLVAIQYRPTSLPLWMIACFGAVTLIGSVGSGVWAAQKTKFNLQATGFERGSSAISAVPRFGQYDLRWGSKTRVDVDANGDQNLDLSEIIHYYDQQLDCATVPAYALRHADDCDRGPSPARR